MVGHLENLPPLSSIVVLSYVIVGIVWLTIWSGKRAVTKVVGIIEISNPAIIVVTLRKRHVQINWNHNWIGNLVVMVRLRFKVVKNPNQKLKDWKVCVEI